MGMNRLLDHRLDAANPRTAARMIPAGKLSWQQSLCWSSVSAVLFILCCALLNRTAFFFSFVVIALLGCYPLTKRFTVMCHWYLGLCLGLTPAAVLVACGSDVSLAALALGGGVMMWVAGFDIIYALSDCHFDRQQSLHSIPARYGTSIAVRLSRICFVLVLLALACTGLLTAVGFWYWLGVACCAVLLVAEHILLTIALAQDNLSAQMARIFFSHQCGG